MLFNVTPAFLCSQARADAEVGTKRYNFGVTVDGRVPPEADTFASKRAFAICDSKGDDSTFPIMLAWLVAKWRTVPAPDGAPGTSSLGATGI